MKKALGFLLVITAFVAFTSFARVGLVLSLIIGFVLWEQCAKALATQRNLRPVRIPLVRRQKLQKAKARN